MPAIRSEHSGCDRLPSTREMLTRRLRGVSVVKSIRLSLMIEFRGYSAYVDENVRMRHPTALHLAHFTTITRVQS